MVIKIYGNTKTWHYYFLYGNGGNKRQIICK